MNLVLLMNLAETLQDLFNNKSDYLFGNGTFFMVNEIKERASIHIFDKHIDVLIEEESKVMTKDILALAHLHHCYLFFDSANERLPSA